MPVNIGVNIQRSPNRINQQLREAGVEGKFPKLLLDFKDQYYLASGGSKTLANAVTHARSGNATMTDGYGPELVTNGGFDSDASGWTVDRDAVLTVTDGKLNIAISTNTYSGIIQEITLKSGGGTYDLELDYTKVNSIARIAIGTTSGGNDLADSSSILSSGKQSVRFTATTETVYVRIYANSVTAGESITIDSVSVREMPVLKWAPHNLLTYSEDFSHSDWTKTNTTVTANAAVAPDGTNTADEFTHTTSSASINRYVAAHAGDGIHQTFSVYLKYVDARWIYAYVDSTYVWVDLLNGVLGTDQTDGATLTAVGNDWYLLEVPEAQVGGAYYLQIGIATGNTQTVEETGTSVYIWGAHLYRSDLGGMVDNPDRGDSYVPTALRPFGSSLVINGAFDTGITGWSVPSGSSSTVSYSSGVMSCYRGNEAIAETALSTPVIAGRAYEITYTVSNISSSSGYVYMSFSGVSTPNSTSFKGNKTHTAHFVAGANTANFRINAGGAGGLTFDIDNISVRESTVRPDTAAYLPRIGHHVYNGSAWVNEGLLAESEARTNLLTYSDFSGGFSAARITKTANQAVSPDGNENASELVETTDSGSHFISVNSTVTASVAHTLSCYVKQSSGSRSAILRTNNVGSTSYIVFDFATETITETGSAARNGTVQNVGNGWYRIAFTHTQTASTLSGYIVALTNSTTPSASLPSYTGDGSSGIYIYGGQIEQAETPSSLVPTGAGATVTRAAETFTIPSANLPWPSPVYTGSELVTNGTFDTDTTGWTGTGGTVTLTSVSGELEVDGDANTFAVQSISVTAGKVYRLTGTARLGTHDGSARVYIGTSLVAVTSTENTDVEIIYVAVSSSTNINLRLHDGVTGGTAYFDNISVREIDPLSVSIAMDGRVSYTKSGSDGFWRWRKDANTYINDVFFTDYRFISAQKDGAIYDQVETDANYFAGDLLESYDIASRHGSTFINAAESGIALTANTTPTLLADFSDTDLDLAYDYMGTVGTFRIWDRDIADTGLVEATNPSLEPSLSLTFEGTGTNSFVVNDWSE